MGCNETTDHEREVPMSAPRQQRWQAVYDGLRTRIDQRKLEPGASLETEAEIAKTYGVGRDAVRRALQRLESHGLITAAHGPYGRRVREYAPLIWPLSEFEIQGKRGDDPNTGVDNWAAGIRAQGRTPAETVEVEDFPAPADVANYLDVEPETWLTRRRRWRYANGELVSIADTWLLDEVAKMPATSENGEKIYPFKMKESVALPGGLVRAVGINQTWTRHVHYSRQPSPTEVDLLDIAPTDPISEVVIIGFDDTDRRFRVMITVSPGHLIAAQYDLQVQQASEGPSS